MKQPEFHFDPYTKSERNPPVLEWTEWELPIVLLHFKQSIIKAAGFSLEDNPCIGVLGRSAWKHHPKDCLIVGPHRNLGSLDDHEFFAVSREAFVRDP